MTHEIALSIALAVALALLGLLGWAINECRCSQCQFHVHERRVKAETAKRESEVAIRKQADARHEYEHKGGAWIAGDPDRFDCPDSACRRNKQRVE